jgi:peroxiredoxin Q/BCP
MGAVVLGVSPDSIESHRKCRTKNQLPYRLLSDEGHRLADAFGIWKEKTLYGRKYMGIERTTVIIDPDGRVAKIFPNVRIPGHVEAVETFLSQRRSARRG